MTTGLVAMYQKGAITADHLVAECLRRVDPENPALVLDSLPNEILLRMLEYAHQFRQGQMVSTYRFLPAIDQINAATVWIDEVQSSRSIGIVSSAAD
jgi:hypothetical protein